MPQNKLNIYSLYQFNKLMKYVMFSIAHSLQHPHNLYSYHFKEYETEMQKCCQVLKNKE